MNQHPHKSWEETWIHELFEEVSAPIVDIVEDTYTQIFPRAILIFSNPDREKLDNLLRAYSEKNAPFALIQLSDEELHYTDLEYHKAAFILKNYWSSPLMLKDPRVVFFPLGYKRNFWEGYQGNSKSACERFYTWSFAGNIARPWRLKMARHMGFIERYRVHHACGFTSKNALSTSQYRDLLLETVFSPCPRGNTSFDSFRIYESLEAGCIPIVQSTHKKDYFTDLLGPHPLIIIEDWKEAPQIVEKLLKDPILLEKRRLECLTFWNKIKKDLKKRVKTLVKEAFRD